MAELIYNQHHIPKMKYRYGLRSSAATGCGWIAVYNALALMGEEPKPARIIRRLLWSFPIINGNFGTFLPNIVGYFKRRGYYVNFSLRRRRFDTIGRNSDACILFYYWHYKGAFGAHYVALDYDEGKFTAYNSYVNSTGPENYGSSLERFIRKRKYFFPILIGISKTAAD